MKFGYFDDANREYVITTPKTPLPWINYLGCNDFFSLISNTCGGYSFYKDAKLLRLTRYRYNDTPNDVNGKYFYIKDGDTIWNPGWKPTKTELDSYECRHGIGYSRFISSKNDVQASVLAFVPMNDTCEINQVKLTNNSSSVKTLSLFSYVEWCLWNADDDMKNFQRNFSTGEVEIVDSTIFHKTEYRERRNHYAVYSVNAKIDGFDTIRDEFLGAYNGTDDPTAVKNGACTNSVASGWQPIASHQINITLNPGETRSFVFVLGYIENPEDEKWESKGVVNKKRAYEMLDRYKTDADVDKAFAELNEYWNGLLSKYTLKSSNDKVDRMVNIWNQYQPLTKKGNSDIGSGFNDDPLWLIAGTSAYVRETGDTTILTEMVPYDNDMSVATPLMGHLKRSFDYTVNHKGPHNLPLIGRADWNDCLNLNCFSEHPGESFQTFGPSEGPVAESVFIAGMFVKYGEEYAQLCELMGDQKEADYAREEVAKMYDAVLKDGWDGDWFVRAYDAYGQKIGSRECEEGQIYIESNGFCSLAGIGVKEGLAKKALDSVKEKLDTKYGVMILQPAYTRYHLELGEISSYPPGYKENAGIFCHNNPWVSIAETVIGRGDRAFEIYQKTCPAYCEEFSEIHRTEPYVYSQMVAGRDAKFHGEAKNSWLTGTAAWTFVNVSQYILGVYPTHNGLSIDPCVPKDFGDFELTRKFREGTYSIKVQNPDKVEKGIKSITVDGKAIDGCVIPYVKGKETYDVVVTMG